MCGRLKGAGFIGGGQAWQPGLAVGKHTTLSRPFANHIPSVSPSPLPHIHPRPEPTLSGALLYATASPMNCVALCGVVAPTRTPSALSPRAIRSGRSDSSPVGRGEGQRVGGQEGLGGGERGGGHCMCRGRQEREGGGCLGVACRTREGRGGGNSGGECCSGERTQPRPPAMGC